MTKNFTRNSSSNSRGHFRLRFSNTNNRNNRSPRMSSEKINIARFINKASANIGSEIKEEIVSRQYSDFNLNPKLLENIATKGYANPTPIQDQAIESIAQGRDLLGIANTGTGKTGAFLIPIINKLISARQEKILVITPTRELAIQIEREFRSLATKLGIYSVVCIGGSNLYKQQKDLRCQYNLVIGTPGRLKDLIDRKSIVLAEFKTIVLDEVDRMLDMGFVKEITKILDQMPKEKQSLFFSATITDKVKGLINKFAKNLVVVSVKTAETAETIDQDIVKYNSTENKLEVLEKLLATDGFDKVLIFGRTKHGVRKLSQKLEIRGFKVTAIHGNKSQSQRQKALAQFHQNQVKILVATDVAARGLDINDVTHVINYDIPSTYDDYVHRIGRTGRANKRGKALTFVM